MERLQRKTSPTCFVRDPNVSERKATFLKAIETWIFEQRCESERMTRTQFGNLGSLERLVAQRQSLLDNLAFYYAQNPKADAATGVLVLTTIFSDNSDGCCTLSIERMARFLSRTPRRVSEAIGRLEGWDKDPVTNQKYRKNPGVIVVDRSSGGSSQIYPWVHQAFGSSKDALTWIMDLRAPRSQGKAGRPRNDNTPDVNVPPILRAPDADDKIPPTSMANTPDVDDELPLTSPSAYTATMNTSKNTAQERDASHETQNLKIDHIAASSCDGNAPPSAPQGKRPRPQKPSIPAADFFAGEGAPGGQWGAEAREYALGLGMPLQTVLQEGFKFKNHHLAKGSAWADWMAAWRYWLSNSRRFTGRNSLPSTDEMMAHAFAEVGQ